MTKKLYYDEQFQRKFQADIISLKKEGTHFHVQLNRTAFYPGGGGQPADRGKIDGKQVLDVYGEGEKIYHILQEKPDQKEDLNCQIDWIRRFDHMQQHTGQHILSAILNNEYGVTTVGFHLGEDYVSIDIDKKMDRELIRIVEEKANWMIYESLPVEILYPDSENLKEIPLRKEPVVEDNIRIVKIDEMDFSPCGGTHLEYTGQVGMIKILEADNYKEGMRIIFQCGIRALRDYEFKNGLVRTCRQLLSVQDEEIVDKTEELIEKLEEREENIQRLKRELAAYEAEKLINEADEVKGIKIVKHVFTEINYNEVQQLAQAITAEDNRVVIMGQQEEDTARLLLNRSENIDGINMNKILSRVIDDINGRGGGNQVKAQGGGDEVEGLKQAVNAAYEIIQDSI